jgi:tRNA pseudouridine55 synthase
VDAWELKDVRDDSVRATITCGSGTYIRALARDLGRLTSSAAHLSALRRIRIGDFDLSDATPLAQLAESPPKLRQLRVSADA